MKKIAILGATGSIGLQAIDVARIFSNDIKIICMSANNNIKELAKQANIFQPEFLSVNNLEDVLYLQTLLNYECTEIIAGKNSLIDTVEILSLYGCDLVVLAVSGIVGLPVFAACINKKIPIALANKEAIVCGANLIKNLMLNSGVPVFPVDSEHCAIFQCLGNSYETRDVARLWLTASGGPFLFKSKEEIDTASISEALKHPNWNMGKKISIDSASMANKGLEVIEAHYLFSVKACDIKVIIQPQSLIHSMVEMKDSSVLAQFAPVDMRLPLQKAMLYPKIFEFNVNKPLDFTKIGKIEFIEPDLNRFPCLELAYDAIKSDITAIYCIADECAVNMFLESKISFGQISKIIFECMYKFSGLKLNSIDDLFYIYKNIKDYILKLLS